jgi:uncharacterized membrane protein YeaQ/YmgE (transglycosylase-associated protein family)
MDGHHLIGWIVIGVIAGFLAARLVEGRGLGCLMNTLVGLAGAIIGGVIIDHVATTSNDNLGFLGSIVVSFIGACVFLGVLRLLGIGGRNRPLGQRRLRS